jgi:hypothetical protein
MPTAQLVVVGVIALVAGLLFLFAGSRLVRPILFLAGLYVGATVAYTILTRAEPLRPYANRQDVLLGSSIAIGVVVGLLAIALVRVGLTLVGALGGFFLAMWIASWSASIYPSTAFLVILVLCIVAGAVAIHWAERHLFIWATSITGAYSFLFGVDVFADVGLGAYLHALLASGSYHEVAGNVGWVLPGRSLPFALPPLPPPSLTAHPSSSLAAYPIHTPHHQPSHTQSQH